jgi:hypothetical protein
MAQPGGLGADVTFSNVSNGDVEQKEQLRIRLGVHLTGVWRRAFATNVGGF